MEVEKEGKTRWKLPEGKKQSKEVNKEQEKNKQVYKTSAIIYVTQSVRRFHVKNSPKANKSLGVKLSNDLLAYWFRAVAYCAKLRCLSPIVFPEK